MACVFQVYSFPFPVLGQQVSCFSYLSSPLPLRLDCAVMSKDRVDRSLPLLFWSYQYTFDLISNLWAVHLNQSGWAPLTVKESLEEKILAGNKEK